MDSPAVYLNYSDGFIKYNAIGLESLYILPYSTIASKVSYHAVPTRNWPPEESKKKKTGLLGLLG